MSGVELPSHAIGSLNHGHSLLSALQVLLYLSAFSSFIAVSKERELEGRASNVTN
jgi:hypothetical protein